MQKRLICLLILLTWLPALGQYAPQAGLPGSTAVPATSSAFTEWASGCTIQRGYLNIANPTLGVVTSGDSSMALGPADMATVSLGDSGVATLTFPGTIFNGPGPDFAVFENGFINPSNDSQAFLELAFVEVSSDGIHYTRFPSQSLTETNVQIPGSGVYMYANDINNLAGKYIGHYGTPFDLEELSGIAGLDINNITHVRIVDVVGSVSGHSSYDGSGRIINDPYPTNFPTGGFDLDAVGVMHYLSNAGVAAASGSGPVHIYPNPASNLLHIDMPVAGHGTKAMITDPTGRVINSYVLGGTKNTIDLSAYNRGIYFIIFTDENSRKWVEKVVKD